MSRILDLAKTFNEQSSKAASDIEKQTQSDLEQLSKSINQALRARQDIILKDIDNSLSLDSVKTNLRSLQSELTAELERGKADLKTAVHESNRALERDIYEHRRKMSMSLFRTWLVALVALGVVAMGLTLWSMIQVSNIADQRRTIATLEEEGGKMNFSRCGDERRLCVQVDERAPNYQGGYRIIKGF